MFRFRLRDLFLKYPALDGLRLSLLAWISTHPAQFFTRTYRITRLYSKGAQAYLKNGIDTPVIFALYHGRMVGLLGLLPRKKVTILISQSRDGEIIARACLDFGFSVARGSNARGGFQAGRELVEAAQEGKSIAYTVDGPRGPSREVKVGIVRLAEVTQLPIVPFVCRARSTYWMGSWDRFMAPFWGTPIVYLFGDPILVPKNADQEVTEEKRGELDRSMKELHDQAEALIRIV